MDTVSRLWDALTPAQATPLELSFTAICAVGFALTSWWLWDAFVDWRLVKRRGINTGRDVVASGDLRAVGMIWVILGLLLGLGVMVALIGPGGGSLAVIKTVRWYFPAALMATVILLDVIVIWARINRRRLLQAERERTQMSEALADPGWK